MNRIEQIILRGLMYDEQFVRRVLPYIDTEYFKKSENTLFKCIKGFIDTYNNLPTKEALIINLNEMHGVSQESIDEINAYLNEIEASKDDETNLDWLVQKTEEWCKERAIENSVMEVINILEGKNKKLDKGIIPKLLQDALAVSFDPRVGHDYIEDATERYEFYHKVDTRIPFHIDYFNKITKNGVPNKTLNIVMAGTGCHAKGTQILMADGTKRQVENIKLGDVLMGPDGNPRNVVKLHRGKDTMYEIEINRTHDKFIVNSEHILSLVHTVKNTICNITVKDFLNQNKKFQHCYKMYYCTMPLEFNNTPRLTIPPYFLGVLLGDGSTNEIATMDKEIVAAVNSFATDWGMSIRISNNGSLASTYHLSKLESYGFGKNFNILAEELKTRYGLIFSQSGTRTKCDQKFIPNEYKISPIETRLELMAGLIDTDGSKVKGGYEFTSKSKILVEDFVFVAQSLGYISHYCSRSINGNVYYRAHIGKTDTCAIIPTKIERKTIKPTTPRKNRSRHGFKIKKLNEDDYYGFELTGDQLYVMGNFIVTHNSGKSLFMCDLASNYLLRQKKVLYITMEMAQERIAERIDANLMDRPLDELFFMSKEAFLNHIKNIDQKTNGSLIIKEYATAQAHVGHFRYLINEIYLKKKFKPDVIFIDYLNICASSRVKASTGMYELVKSIAEELRGLAVEFDVPVWSATQTNRAGFKSSDPDLTNTSESFGLPATCDFLFALITSDELKNMNQLLVKILKNRYGDIMMRNKETGKTMNKFAVGVDYSKQKLYNLDESAQKNITQDNDLEEAPDEDPWSPFQEDYQKKKNMQPKEPPTKEPTVDTVFEIDLPTSERPFNSAEEDAERRRLSTKPEVDSYKPDSAYSIAAERERAAKKKKDSEMK